MNNELRWKQRFQNFEKAFLLIDEVADFEPETFSQLEKEGVVQRFEILIELSWKVLKDYLENEGYDDVANGKKAIRQAFVAELITNPESWMEALEKRNLTSHTYNEEILTQIIDFIQQTFYPIARDLYQILKSKI